MRRGSPKRPCKHADRHPPAAHHPHVPYLTPRHTRGHNNRTHTEHPRRSRSRLGRAPHHTRRADRARSHGSALQPTYRPPRELSGPDSGRRRRGRSSGGTRGSWKRLVSRARPTKGRLTCGRVQGLNRLTRPERFTDLESRAPRRKVGTSFADKNIESRVRGSDPKQRARFSSSKN